MTTTKWIGAISTAFNVALNWDNGVPSPTVDAVFDGTAVGNCNINLGGPVFEAKSVTFTGFTRTFLGGDQGMFIYGNVTLASTTTYTGKPALYIKPTAGNATLTSDGVHIKVLGSRAEPRVFTIFLGDDCYLDGYTDFRDHTTFDFTSHVLYFAPQASGERFEMTGTGCHVAWTTGAKLVCTTTFIPSSSETVPYIYVYDGLTAPKSLPPVEKHGVGYLNFLAGNDNALLMQSFTMDAGRLYGGYIDVGSRTPIQTTAGFTATGGEFWMLQADPDMGDDLHWPGMTNTITVGGNSAISITMSGTKVGGTTLAVTGTNVASGGITITDINASVTALTASGCVNGGGNTNVTFGGGGNPGAKSRGGAVGSCGLGF